MTILPHELYDCIISMADGDQDALADFSMIDRNFRARSQSLMWQTLHIPARSRRYRDPDADRSLPLFINFLLEESSQHLLRLPTTAVFIIGEIKHHGLDEVMPLILHGIANVKNLLLQGDSSPYQEVYSIGPSKLWDALVAHTFPRLHILILDGFEVPLLEIARASPLLHHLSLRQFIATKVSVAEHPLLYSTALRSLTVDSYGPIDFEEGSSLLAIVLRAVTQRTFRVLHLPERASTRPPPLRSAKPLLDICNSSLTHFHIGWEFLTALVIDDDMTPDTIISFRQFPVLQTLQFEIRPSYRTPVVEYLARARPFFAWVSAEIRGLQTPGIFASLICDICRPHSGEPDESDLGQVDHWTELDDTLTDPLLSGSVVFVLRASSEYLPLLREYTASRLPLSSQQGLIEIRLWDIVHTEIGQYINSAVLRVGYFRNSGGDFGGHYSVCT
ncbi:hypothetical protein DL96DRAFT_1620525 [Flagelloscypha sp. PMI_526]|nr:hypothetical protein DL96DRAFT_1620525 [Flagelloscypha sp. PMI_526]